MRRQYDVIVAGLGAAGSATVHQLAQRGAAVLGLDRYSPPHGFGSSHGRSRIIREAYAEGSLYVPFVQRAYECWADLERQSGQTLFAQTGGLMIGPEDGPLVRGALTSAREHDLPHEVLSASEVHHRFPGLIPRLDMVGVWEPRAGVLFPERAIETQLMLATRAGAELRFEEPLAGWRKAGDNVEVTTPAGTYAASRLVLAAGAWTRSLLPDLDLPLVVERTVIYWFRPEPATDRFAPDRFPVFIFEISPDNLWYGFPDLGEGVKAALHHQGESTDADTVRRAVGPEEVARIRAIVQSFMPDADGPLVDSAVCMYTNTPDGDFLIDFHPSHSSVLIASPCSGHGFKFSSAIGEILADLAMEGRSRFDLAPFRLDRFGKRE
jgi:sarcosine oxidase